MIDHIKHNDIDKAKWDNALAGCSNRMIYACSWYLDVVCPGWEALIEGNYQAIMPLTAGKKYSVRYLYPPFFTQQLGVFAKRELTEAEVSNFLEAIPSSFKFSEISLNSKNTYSGKTFTVKKNINHELDLSPAYETLHKDFSENTARNIRKALKQDLQLLQHISVREVISLFRANRGKEVGNLTDRHYTVFKKLAEECLSRKHAQTWGVKSPGGELLAGAVLLEHFGRTIFIFSGMSEEGKKTGAMFFLLNSYFKAYSSSPIIFDFEGSNNADLARFYRSFGSKECVYLQVRRNSLPKLFRWLKK
jgi:hypothetical protein